MLCLHTLWLARIPLGALCCCSFGQAYAQPVGVCRMSPKLGWVSCMGLQDLAGAERAAVYLACDRSSLVHPTQTISSHGFVWLHLAFLAAGSSRRRESSGIFGLQPIIEPSSSLSCKTAITLSSIKVSHAASARHATQLGDMRAGVRLVTW